MMKLEIFRDRPSAWCSVSLAAVLATCAMGCSSSLEGTWEHDDISAFANSILTMTLDGSDHASIHIQSYTPDGPCQANTQVASGTWTSGSSLEVTFTSGTGTRSACPDPKDALPVPATSATLETDSKWLSGSYDVSSSTLVIHDSLGLAVDFTRK